MRKIITVKSFLKQLEPLQVKLVSGHEGADKIIDYINIQEFALKSDRIKKNGVLMTTFASFPDSQKIIEHMEWLLSKEIHAVGIHRVFLKEIPDEVISFSNANHLPLFSIPEDISYQQIMQVYFDLLVEDTNKKRVDLEQINMNMLRSVALEKGTQYIISIMGKYLKLPIIHLDKHLNVKSFWAEGVTERREIQNFVEKLTDNNKDFLMNEGIFNYHFASENSQIHAIRVVPLMDNRNFYGCIIIGLNKEFTVLDESVVNYGKTAMLLEAIKSNTMEKYLRNNDMKLIESILEKPKKKAGEFYDLSLQVKDLNVIYLIEFTDVSLLHKSFEYIYQEISKWDDHTLIWMFNDQIICIAKDNIPLNLLSDISDSYEEMFIGISDRSSNVNPESIPEKYEQAQFGLRAGKNRGTKINEWTDLGYDKYLFAVHQNEVLQNSAINLLKPLIEYDERFNTELIRTLSIYLDSFFSLKKSAATLFIHKNTVKYRINKIKEIYKDINLEEPETYLLFSSSLKIYKILVNNR